MSKKINTITGLKIELEELLIKLEQDLDLDEAIQLLKLASSKLEILKNLTNKAELEINKIKL